MTPKAHHKHRRLTIPPIGQVDSNDTGPMGCLDHPAPSKQDDKGTKGPPGYAADHGPLVKEEWLNSSEDRISAPPTDKGDGGIGLCSRR